MPEPLLALRGVATPSEGGKALFRGLDLEVPAHSRWLILGRGGSGKSTLLRMAAGLLEPPEGEVKRWGAPRSAFAFRDAGLLSALTLEENLALPLRYEGRDAAPALAAVAEALGLREWLGARPHELSPTLRRMANLGRVFVQDPDLAYLDDPLGDLDPRTHGRAVEAFQAFLAARPRTLLIAATEPTPYEPLRGLRRVLLSGGRLKPVGEVP